MVGRFHGMLICETFKICCLMGKHRMRDVLGNNLTDHQSVWFIGWVLPYFFERSVKNPSIWKESLTWIVPWIRSVRGRNLEGWRTGCRSWGVGNDGRIGNLLKKTQRKGTNVSQRKWKFYFFSRWRTSQICWRRFTKSQTLLAERRVIPYSTEIHWLLQNYSYKLGCNARKPHRWLLEYRWIQRFVWFLDRFHSFYSVKWETSRRIYVVRGETDKTASDIQARSYMARTLEEIVKKC